MDTELLRDELAITELVRLHCLCKMSKPVESPMFVLKIYILQFAF